MRPQTSGEKWLVISYYYGIDGLACSHHIEDRVAALNKIGIETQVLCRTSVHSAPFMRLEKFSTYLEKFKKTRGIARIINGLYLVLTLVRGAILTFREWDEVLCALDLMAEGYALTQRERFSRIYSTGGPMGAHIVALLIAARTRLPLITEFQDPLPFQYPHRFRKLALFVEKMAMKRAHCVFVTRQAAVAAARRCHGPIPTHVYPGAKPIKKRDAPRRESTLQLAHFGTLYRGRNTAHFLTALKQLLDERPELQSVLQFHCYGAFDRAAYQTMAFPIRGVLQLHDRISRTEATQIMATMDVLLLIQHIDPVSTETIPSKVYEYLQTGKPIFALTYRNLELAEMLERLGHVAVEADDEKAIYLALKDIALCWKQGGHPTPLPSPYTTERAARELVQAVV
jgi:glycosyltransferase involved in cell wall biosynthesis